MTTRSQGGASRTLQLENSLLGNLGEALRVDGNGKGGDSVLG